MKSFTINTGLLLIALGISTIVDASPQEHTKKHDRHDVLKDDHLDDHDHHEAEEHKALQKRLANMKKAEKYSCQLQDFSNQCREYPIPDRIKYKIPDLKESCESMPGGTFAKAQCPTQNRIGRCVHIQRNYHDPDTLIYDNHYYSGDKRWTNEVLGRVCKDLEGELLKG